MDAFSYAHGASTTPLLGETIGENLRKTTERFPDREALVVRSQGYRATYRGLWDATTRVARALIARGIARGDRVAIWSPNRFECRAGWMHTGDLATMDDEGYVNIVGRIKDMIICGGENVYPREVVTEFPMTVTGKVQKFRMRDMSIAELGLTAVAGAPTA